MKISYSPKIGKFNSQDVLVLFLGEGEEPSSTQVSFVGPDTVGLISQVMKQDEFHGKKGQHCLVHTALGRILLIGVGTVSKIQPFEFRIFASQAIRLASYSPCKRLFLRFSKKLESALGHQASLQYLVEGLILTDYRFDKYKSKEHKTVSSIQECQLLFDSAQEDSEVKSSIERATWITDAVIQVRDWVNEPPCEMTPLKMAENAKLLAKKYDLEVKVFSQKQCQEMGMGLFLAVAKGSDLEPQFVHMIYRPQSNSSKNRRANKSSVKKIALVGKGITFDSGGLTLKTPEGMMTMKCDMAGGAIVLATMSTLAALHCPYEVHAVVPLAENMISGCSYRLGDIYTSMIGKTVEINNTDAEGRLIMADAFGYVQKEIKPDEMFDFATLTGACMVALGPYMAGVMGNDQVLMEKWLAAAQQAGEEMWQLPIHERIKEGLRSDVADMKNAGPRYGSAIAAAHFLKEFVGNIPWVHVDLAGPAFLEKDWAYQGKGGTGYGVSSLIEYLAPRR